MSKSRRYGTRRLEVFSMWFEDNKMDKIALDDYLFRHSSLEERECSEEELREELLSEYWVRDKLFRVQKEKRPADFKGRIFISDQIRFFEIYNSKIKEEGSLFYDLKNFSSIKAYKGEDSVISEHSDLLLGSPPNDVQQQMQEEDSVVDRKKTHLPLMGPNAGPGLVGDTFIVIVHRDSGNASIDASYVPTVASLYAHLTFIPCDDWGQIDYSFSSYRYDEPFLYDVDGEYHSLVLDCIVFSDSKSVQVEVTWVVDGSDPFDANASFCMCGELSVISAGRKSILFKTPPNKAKIVLIGEPIPMLKSVVAVPYDSDFKFMADLGLPDNVGENPSLVFPTVNGSVDFRGAKIDEDKTYTAYKPDEDKTYTAYKPVKNEVYFPEDNRCKLYKCKDRIRGIGGYLEVTCIVDII